MNGAPEDPGPDEGEVRRAVDEALAHAKAIASAPAPAPHVEEVGRVVGVGVGVAFAAGLRQALADEMVRFPSAGAGLVADLDENHAGVILLCAADAVAVGDQVERTREVVSAPVGEDLLGRVVDPLGQPLDGKPPIVATKRMPIEAQAPKIMDRGPIDRPMATGLTAIDAAVPIGRGQRELIIGDRQTGKTSIAVDAMLNQASSDVVCVYCAIGQRGDAVARVIAALDAGGVADRSIVVAASGDAGPGLAYIAPYAATTMAEWFVAAGRDVLIVYDDLTKHANAYRELSLLLRRPPGREAYPGDIFYLHARLLERACQLSEALGGGSLTALAVTETQAENLSAYIPTNLISITDGQVYLSPGLAQKGRFPAVDLGRSVSRVGGKAQSAAYRAVASPLRVALSQYEELESFARFGTRLDEDTRLRLKRGAAIAETLRQHERAPISEREQLVALVAAMEGLLDDAPEAEVGGLLAAIRSAGCAAPASVVDDRAALLDLARGALSRASGGGDDPGA